MKDLHRKCEQRLHASDKYGDLGMSTTLWALGRMMANETSSRLFSAEFIKSGFSRSDSKIDSIIEQN